MQQRITISTAWMEPPWHLVQWPVESDQIEEDYGVPADLTAAVEAWDQLYQDLMDPEYPPDSPDFTPEELAAFLDRGRELTLRVRQYVPADVEVAFGGRNHELHELF